MAKYSHKDHNTDDSKKGMIDLSKLDTSFGEDNEPQDEKLMTLLKQAYQKKIYCRKAIINLALIEPFSDYQPKITAEYRAYFLKKYLDTKPPELFVYQDPKSDKFIMSDDYSAYYMYKEVQAITAICVIIGEYKDNQDVTAGEKYYLDLPVIEIRE